MPVVTITRKYASGGRKLGRHLANVLNYKYVDKYIFQKVAENLNVSEGTLESFEKSGQYRVLNMFSSLFSKNYIERIAGYDKTIVQESEYQEALKSLVLQVAAENNVVIVGRASHFFLRNLQDCYRLRLIASKDWRRDYAIRSLKVRPANAEGILEERDRNHEWFLNMICGEDSDNPLLYHLTLNMDLVSFERAAELSLALLK
jgi:cytidylate kinase